MHYSSPILKSPTYIITYFWMHYICMCIYIMAYMCIYTDFHVMDLFMYYWYINVFIYLYIYMLCFFLCVCVRERMNVCKFETFPLLLLSPTGLTSCLFQELLHFILAVLRIGRIWIWTYSRRQCKFIHCNFFYGSRQVVSQDAVVWSDLGLKWENVRPLRGVKPDLGTSVICKCQPLPRPALGLKYI